MTNKNKEIYQSVTEYSQPVTIFIRKRKWTAAVDRIKRYVGRGRESRRTINLSLKVNRRLSNLHKTNFSTHWERTSLARSLTERHGFRYVSCLQRSNHSFIRVFVRSLQLAQNNSLTYARRGFVCLARVTSKQTQ